MSLVAGLVKTFPQRVVRHATLVRLLPLLAQQAQVFLHLASANRLTIRAFEQVFGFGHQLFTQLIGAPTLPTLEFTRSGERGMGLAFKLVVDDSAEFLECIAQCASGTGTGFSMAFGHF